MAPADKEALFDQHGRRVHGIVPSHCEELELYMEKDGRENVSQRRDPRPEQLHNEELPHHEEGDSQPPGADPRAIDVVTLRYQERFEVFKFSMPTSRFSYDIL